jgi:hypothetical protein
MSCYGIEFVARGRLPLDPSIRRLLYVRRGHPLTFTSFEAAQDAVRDMGSTADAHFEVVTLNLAAGEPPVADDL